MTNFPGCYLDQHPNAEDIAAWLRAGLTSTAINNNLAKLGDTRKHSAMAISVHRTKCLDLRLHAGGRPRVQAIDIPDDTPSLEEMGDLAMRVFYHRLKTDPAGIATRELVPFLGAFLRMKAAEKPPKAEPPRDLLDEAMNELAAEAP